MDGSFTDDKVHQWLQEIADSAWVSLHFDTPALGGVGNNEISGGGYLRQKGIFSPPANRAIWTLEDARFTGLTQTVIAYMGINDSANGGLLLAYGELTKQTIRNGAGYILHAGDVALSMG